MDKNTPKDASNNDIPTDECLRTLVRKYLTTMLKPQPGKACHCCRLRKIFSHICRACSCKSDTTEETFFEEYGKDKHINSTENFVSGMPHSYKERANKSLKLHHELTLVEAFPSKKRCGKNKGEQDGCRA